MILDTTLREGVQSRLWKLTDRQRLALAHDLASAGVREIEVGCAGRDQALPALVRAVRRGGGKALVWCPSRADLLDAALDADPDGICLSVPVSDAHLGGRLGMDRSTLLRRLDELLARLEGRFVVLGLEDASRADPVLVERIAHLAGSHGVRRLRFADTLGLLDPAATGRVVSWLAEVSGLAIGFHGHDDFGMATANALAALDAGAECVDASLGGWGERAGIASLEQIAAWLVLRRGELGPDPARVAHLARRTASHAGVDIPSTRAILGCDLFRCGSGLHVDGLQKNPHLYEPFDPSRVGARRHLEFGAQTGRSALKNLLSALGHSLDPGALDRLVENVRTRARDRGSPLETAEVLALASNSPISRPLPHGAPACP